MPGKPCDNISLRIKGGEAPFLHRLAADGQALTPFSAEGGLANTSLLANLPMRDERNANRVTTTNTYSRRQAVHARVFPPHSACSILPNSEVAGHSSPPPPPRHQNVPKKQNTSHTPSPLIKSVLNRATVYLPQSRDSATPPPPPPPCASTLPQRHKIKK